VRVAVVGAGAVGARVARQLAATDAVSALYVVTTSRPGIIDSLGPRAYLVGELDSLDLDTVVFASGALNDVGAARRHLEAGHHVVSTADAPEIVDALLALDDVARANGRACVVGAGLSPGLSGLLTSHLAIEMDEVEEIHVAKSGTGGPACAREHHRALSSTAVEWIDGVLEEHLGGSGRELCWFPSPVGARDCYRADLVEPVLLGRSFPRAAKITARVAATRRDRFLGRLPMLRAPHLEGVDGAVRVEVRGRRGAATVTAVAGAAAPPAVAAGAVAAGAALFVWRTGTAGAQGCCELGRGNELLGDVLNRGVHVARFVGQPV
jgi:saccharopine dehydrogenase-like NADP-dependent oxidoreductase